jgi:DNA polymerase-1
LDVNVFGIDPLKWIRTDTKLFLQEFMFQPQYILDYLALVWDSSDNIKWVAWIWPKKASELIKKYQTIDNIYLHIDELTWEIKQKLFDWKEAVAKSRDLIQLKFIEEMRNLNINDFKMQIDFEKYKKVLVGQYWFRSFEKWLDDLKRKIDTPMQTSLF